jgi:replicative DNA helicase
MNAEEIVIAHYLGLRRADVRSSPVRPEFFTSPIRTKAWALALTGSPTLVDTPDEVPSEDEVKQAERELAARWARKHAAAALRRSLKALEGGEDVTSVASSVNASLAEASTGGLVSPVTHRDAALHLAEQWIRDLQTDDARTLPMPWRNLNEIYGGWPRGKLVYVGGRSSEHKTTFARCAAEHVARAGHRALFWTLEDSTGDVAARTVAADQTGLTTRDLATGTLAGRRPTLDSLNAVASGIQKHVAADWATRLSYLDEPTSPARFAGVVSALSARGLDLVVVDYFQLLRGSADADSQFYELAAQTLHDTAKRLNVCIIATSQIDKVGTQASEDAGRVPKASEMLFGTILKRTAHGVIMVGKCTMKDKTPGLECVFEKWKWATAGATIKLAVDPAHDRLVEP